MQKNHLLIFDFCGKIDIVIKKLQYLCCYKAIQEHLIHINILKII